MILICSSCKKIFEESDRVTVEVTSTFHIIKSERAFCLDKNDLYADSSTMRHEECPE